MRKSSRKKDAGWALDVLQRAPYATLSMVRPDGTPYAVPISVVKSDGCDDVFYFHCAGDGEKLDCMQSQPIVSLTAVTKCSPTFEESKENYTMYYHSAVAFGRAEIVSDEAEKIEALRLLCERFLPRYMDHFDAAIARSLGITTVVRVKLTEPPVGKSKPA